MLQSRLQNKKSDFHADVLLNSPSLGNSSYNPPAFGQGMILYGGNAGNSYRLESDCPGEPQQVIAMLLV